MQEPSGGLADVAGREKLRSSLILLLRCPTFLVFRWGRRLGQGQKVLGINVTPLCMRRSGARFVPSYDGRQQEYERDWPEAAAVVRQAGISYSRILTEVVDSYLSRGWAIWCMPFSPGDELFAQNSTRL